MLWMHQRSFDMDTDTKLLEVTTGGEVPEFVKQYIRDAIDDGALFSDFDMIPSRDLMNLRSVFKDELTTDGWTINSMRDTLMSFAPELDKFEAERIARTETAAVLNTAREESYVIEYPDAKFYWSGRLDNRTTAACEWLVKETNPGRRHRPPRGFCGASERAEDVGACVINTTDYEFPEVWGLMTDEQKELWFAIERCRRQWERQQPTVY